ncbi:hypothetical protein [Haemophilus parainfluenzae]|jgi:hypothetical protein|uniref:hypothetical protein n=1 Tax=Haemophilus parainfluenzae TaxID=729 RepID=UPI00066CAE8D|nr:hypothetical protein [Haemophilus parainfluenzae]MBS5999506.1 hypothetical protein [Haemophilus haemolyticus]RDF04456.1 hypothetical protein DPV89_01935 [Haemophilus parainfluenzae]
MFYKNKLLCLGLLAIPAIAIAEFYKIEITRLDSNLYRTTDGIYIETEFCHEYARGDEAVLSYEQYSYDNKLIFQNGETCDVKRIFK